MGGSRLQQLSDQGQSIWINYLSRDLLETGELARLVESDAVVGVISNPTIFQKAISAGSAYDEQLKEPHEPEDGPKQILYELVAGDVIAGPGRCGSRAALLSAHSPCIAATSSSSSSSSAA